MAARLHRERIVREGQPPSRWLIMTHGIYGAGGNFRSIARQLTELRPEWGVVLADLRQHGRSEPGVPPHTIDACADDFEHLVEELARDGVVVEAFAGHSFGGKVVLAAATRTPVTQTWVLDASPSARPDAFADPHTTVVAVLELLERLATPWQRREDFVAAVIAQGHAPELANWLAMNLVPQGPGVGLILRFDLGAIRELLASYFATDLWSAVEQNTGTVEFVVATRSTAWSDADRARATLCTRARIHAIEAGHWLHVEAPASLVASLARGLP